VPDNKFLNWVDPAKVKDSPLWISRPTVDYAATERRLFAQSCLQLARRTLPEGAKQEFVNLQALDLAALGPFKVMQMLMRLDSLEPKEPEPSEPCVRRSVWERLMEDD
jgi:hypothetical protein